MHRREFLTLSASALAGSALSGCAYLNFDTKSVFLRSEFIDTPEKEMAVVSKAKLSYTDDGKVRVLHVQGTPYEMGFQQGYLLREEVQANMGYLYDQAVDKFHIEELFDEVYERMRPFIPQQYIDEMHGLAHGSKLPLRVIHGVHILPEIGEWGGKKKIGQTVKKMLKGELGTSCSNLSTCGTATADGKMYTVRILDWGLHRISKLHQYPLLLIAKPENGIPYCNIGWVGFLGAISGINAQGITLGEMGYGDYEYETLHGEPMPFLLRDVMQRASNLADVRKIIQTAPPTNSFIFLMSDGKNQEAELYIRDPNQFTTFKQNTLVADVKHEYPPIPGMIYGGHYQDKMIAALTANNGKITPELLMKEIIPQIVMPSNFQDVVYAPQDLKFWVANAKDKESRAAESDYTFFDFGKSLGDFPKV